MRKDRADSVDVLVYYCLLRIFAICIEVIIGPPLASGSDSSTPDL